MYEFNRRHFIKASSLVTPLAMLGISQELMAATVLDKNTVGATASHMSAEQAAAWSRYLAVLEEMRTYIFSYPLAERPDVRAQANDFFMQLQGQAWMNVLAVREQYPRFMVNTVGEPLLSTALLQNPDFRYQYAWLDGRRTYRIRGQYANALFLDFQVQCDVGVPKSDRDVFELNKAANAPWYYSLGSDFKADESGYFEIIASAKPHKGNWLKLNGDWPINLILVRDCIYDWDAHVPTKLDVDVVDGARVPLDESEADFIQRIDRAARYVSFYCRYYGSNLTDLLLKSSGGVYNKFVQQVQPKEYGASQRANYFNFLYEITPDEALIIEFERPSAKYWGVQLGDVYWRTTDYVYFQSSLNGTQAEVDGDGRIRLVLSEKDPGVPNWIDTAGRRMGIVQFRQYHFEKSIEIPVAKKVSVTVLRDNLPKSTRIVLPDERRDQLERRRRSVLRRYGYGFK